MITLLIRQATPDCRDPKIFRAYTIPDESCVNAYGRNKIESLKVSCSTTGNAEHGALNCAAKAFIKLNGEDLMALPDNQAITRRIYKVGRKVRLFPCGQNSWTATLDKKGI